MKNKYKFLLLFSIFIFSSVFFAGIVNVRAEEDVPYGPSAENGYYPSIPDPDFDPYANSDQDSWSDLNPYEGSDQDFDCPEGEYEGRDGKCYPNENLGTVCVEDEYMGRDGNCYPKENLAITTCPDGEYKGRDGQCYPNTNLTDQPDAGACSIDNDCTEKFGNGYKCDSTGTCMVDGFFDGTECKTNADCDRYYGAGFECRGVFVSTCERVSTGGSGGGTITPSAPRPIATTTQPISLKNGTVAPANTVVNSDGSGKDATGQTYPPGSFQADGISSGGNLVMCAGGILAAECRDANGNQLPGANLNIIAPPTGGGLGNVAGVNRVTAPKCGTNFADIGGVCFPTNTGLSNAPIYVILSNIFSWLMGLFTTLAVIAFVISGIQYLTAAGDSKRMEDGKNNAMYAIMGIIVGLSGFIIIKAIAAALAGQGYFF